MLAWLQVVVRIVLIQFRLISLLLLQMQGNTFMLPGFIHRAECLMCTVLYLLRYAVRFRGQDLPGSLSSHVQ